MMKTFFSVLWLCLCTTIMAQEKLTLKQCIETALANNLDVFQSGLQAESDKINMKQAKLNLLPDLNASGSHNFSSGRSIDPYSNSPVTQNISSSNFGINSGVILFNGMSMQNFIKQNALAYEASKMDWQQMKDNLTISVILAYLQVLSQEDQLVQARNQAILSQRQVERLDIQNKEGAITPSAFSDLKGQYAGDQLAIINAQNALESAKLSLCQLMNIPYSRNMVLERVDPALLASQYEETPDKIYETAVTQLALVKAADLRKQSAEKAVKVAKGQLFPTLSFGAGAATSYSSIAFQNHYLNTTYSPSSDSAIVGGVKYPVFKYQDNFSEPTRISYRDQLDNNVSTFYGFSLRVPIFNSLQQRNRVKQAKINLKSREFIAKTTRTQLSQAIEQAHFNMLAAADRYKVLREQVAAYQESFRIAEVRFNAGVGNSIDYLTAKNNLDRANISMINAQYDYILRTKVLDYYQGKQLW